VFTRGGLRSNLGRGGFKNKFKKSISREGAKSAAGFASARGFFYLFVVISINRCDSKKRCFLLGYCFFIEQWKVRELKRKYENKL
jgi:hypothetical protein